MTTLEAGTRAYHETFTTESELIQTQPGVQLITLYTRILRELSSNPSISQEKLARRLDVTMRTVQRHIEELEKEEFIRVNREKRPFTYRIIVNEDVPHLPGWLVRDLLGQPH